ncbi:MAG: phytanoyl-CoA dioxygenase family protein [Myxococcota bacterium]
MQSGLTTMPVRFARRFRSAVSAGPDLHRAAGSGDAERVRVLLDAGADVQLRDRRGQTALHIAAGCGRDEVAAMLLTRGADHTIEDAERRRPLSAKNVDPETMHRIRQRYRRAPSPAMPHAAAEHAKVPEEWLEGLRNDGIFRIPGLIAPEMLSQMQSEFAGFVRSIDERLERGEGEMRSYDEEEHWWAEDLAYVSNNAFKHSPSLTRFFCEPRLTALAEAYYGKHAFLTRGVAMRYLPHDSRENDMFGWHHDLEERRMKVLILLTDVETTDQVMTYVKGSHRLYHPYKMFFRNSVDLRYCEKELDAVEIMETTGRAGDVFLFDSNGIHRGNRKKNARIRDTFFIEYGIDESNLWGGNPQEDVIGQFALPQVNPFEELLAAPKKWEKSVRRRLPTWLENLYEVDAWRSQDDGLSPRPCPRPCPRPPSDD